MTASTLIDSLAGRGLVLSIEGKKLWAAPASQLTDEDCRLIRRFRAELFALLAAKTGSQPGDPGPLTPGPPVMAPIESNEAIEGTGGERASMVASMASMVVHHGAERGGDRRQNHAIVRPGRGFVGFVGGSTHTYPDLDPAYEAELDARIDAQIAAEPIPAPTVWRAVVARWSDSRRQAWANRAEAHQVAGTGWREAEWLAFAATAGEQGHPPDAGPRVTPDLAPFPEFEDLPGREDLEHAKNWNRLVDPMLTSPAPADGSLTPSTSASRRWRCGNRYCLHKGRWWLSRHSVVNCVNCAPPGFPELVVAEGDASNAPAVALECSRQAVDYPRSIPVTVLEPSAVEARPAH